MGHNWPKIAHLVQMKLFFETTLKWFLSTCCPFKSCKVWKKPSERILRYPIRPSSMSFMHPAIGCWPLVKIMQGFILLNASLIFWIRSCLLSREIYRPSDTHTHTHTDRQTDGNKSFDLKANRAKYFEKILLPQMTKIRIF